MLDIHHYGIVRDLVGHGVGHQLHEEPDIANYGIAGEGPKLRAGMTIAIEPMANLGVANVVMDPDGWTIRTRDGQPSAHFEHTILILENGAETVSYTHLDVYKRQHFMLWRLTNLMNLPQSLATVSLSG